MTVSTGAGQPVPFTVTTLKQAGGMVVAEVGGDLDLSTSPQLRRVLIESLKDDPPAVVIDMTGVGFCDSTGLSALVHLNNQCSAADIELTITPSRVVRRAIELTGLASTLTIA